MTLSYISTGTEVIVLLERGADGRERICTATPSEQRTNGIMSSPKWDCEMTLPSGKVYRESFIGSRAEVSGALGNWSKSKRDDQPEYETSPLSRSVSLGGGNVATVTHSNLRFKP